MKYTYETITSEFGLEIIKRIDELKQVVWIPCDLANSDYQEYLGTLDEAAPE